jgi:pimeloyl-ACP methyl ester carboxylesterase
LLVVPSILAAQAPEPAPSSEVEAHPPGTLLLSTVEIPREDGGVYEAERGVLYVPANRATPGTGVIALEFHRFPAGPEADPSTPPVFRLNGGPGWPGFGSQLEREGFFEEYIAPRFHLADVVVVGQRGIGSSAPNTACESAEPLGPDIEPTLEVRATQMFTAAQRCRAKWEGEGVDLSGLTVIEAAADVNDVREALGYERIQVHGGSFGSHWGMTVLRYYPEIVERAVLNGMEGPDHTYDMPGWVLKALERTAADAEASGALGDRIPAGGLIAAFREVIERADSEPITVRIKRPGSRDSVDVILTGEDFRSLWSGFTPSLRGHRMAGWPADIIRLHEGDFRVPANRQLASRTRAPGIPTAAFFMLDCGSGISPARAGQMLEDRGAEVVGNLGWFYQVTCPAWDADLGDKFRENFDTDIPTVIVHGNWDMSTPLENALQLVPHFKVSRFVLVERGTHGALSEALDASDEFRMALERFVTTGDMSGLPEKVVLPPVEWRQPPER